MWIEALSSNLFLWWCGVEDPHMSPSDNKTTKAAEYISTVDHMWMVEHPISVSDIMPILWAYLWIQTMLYMVNINITYLKWSWLLWNLTFEEQKINNTYINKNIKFDYVKFTASIKHKIHRFINQMFMQNSCEKISKIVFSYCLIEIAIL